MAGKSLGTLTIDLIAQVGGFTKGMDQAERATDKWRKKVESDVLKVGAAFGTAATAAAATTLALIKSTSEHATETDRWAKSLGMSTSSLMQWQYAAKQAGLTGDNIADIFKDLNDKIGDAVLNSSGEAAQALDTLGLSAKKLQNLTPDKQLLAMAHAMERMNTAQKTNILESMGNDLSKLIPLLNDGAKGINEFQKRAVDLKIAPSDDDIAKLVSVNKVFQSWEDSIDGFRNEFAIALSDIDLTPITDSLHEIESVLTDPGTLQGMSELVQDTMKLATFLSKSAAGLGVISKLVESHSHAVFGGTDKTDVSDLLAQNRWLKLTFRGDSDEYKNNLSRINFLQGLKNGSHVNQDAGQEMLNLLQQMNISDVGLEAGGTNGKPHKPKKPPKVPVDHPALKLENSFASTEQGYLKQIALIDTTGKKSVEVTEQQKLAFDLTTGKLSGLNDLQQKRLQSLASEVDHLNAVKKANEDNAKVAAYVATLKQSNDNNKQDLQSALSGAGMGEKARSRMKEIASLRQDFSNQQLELNKQYNDDGNKDLYEKETQALSSALDERLSNLQDYYKQADEMESEWSSGISESLQNFVNDSQNYYQQAADATTSLLGTAVSSIGDNLTDVITGTENLKDAFSNIMADIGKTVIDQLAQMAAQWLVYEGVQLLTGKATQASASSMTVANAQAMSALAQINAYASAAAVPYFGYLDAPLAAAQAAAITEPLVAVASASSLAGMAHDGLDSVPETGTWLLQKGERVTTAQTSSKLDKTLDRVSRDSNKSSPAITMHQNFNVNGDPSDAQIAMMKKAAADGAKQGYQQVVRDMSSGTGQVHKAMTGNYKAPRRIG